MVSRIDWRAMPIAVAYAFATAHRPSDVYVALRFYDSSAPCWPSAIGFLNGSHFPKHWDLPNQGSPVGYEDFALFKDIRDSAVAYLRSLADAYGG